MATVGRAFVKDQDRIAAWMNSAPPSLAEASSLFSRMPNGVDEYRFELQSLRSWLNEQFEAEETHLFLGSFACHAGVGPDDMGGGHLVWLFTSLIQTLGNRVVKGGCTVSLWRWPPTSIRRVVRSARGPA